MLRYLITARERCQQCNGIGHRHFWEGVDPLHMSLVPDGTGKINMIETCPHCRGNGYQDVAISLEKLAALLRELPTDTSADAPAEGR